MGGREDKRGASRDEGECARKSKAESVLLSATPRKKETCTSVPADKGPAVRTTGGWQSIRFGPAPHGPPRPTRRERPTQRPFPPPPPSLAALPRTVKKSTLPSSVAPTRAGSTATPPSTSPTARRSAARTAGRRSTSAQPVRSNPTAGGDTNAADSPPARGNTGTSGRTVTTTRPSMDGERTPRRSRPKRAVTRSTPTTASAAAKCRSAWRVTPRAAAAKAASPSLSLSLSLSLSVVRAPASAAAWAAVRAAERAAAGGTGGAAACATTTTLSSRGGALPKLTSDTSRRPSHPGSAADRAACPTSATRRHR